jgi:2-methylaconitate isomerase
MTPANRGRRISYSRYVLVVKLPEVLERQTASLEVLRNIGACARVAVGLAADIVEASQRLPMIAVVSPPKDAPTLSGQTVPEAVSDLCIRMLSSGQPHRALPGTGAIATAVAMQVPGTIAQRLARTRAGPARTVAMPSGPLTIEATVENGLQGPVAIAAVVQRTARRLFEGWVHV